MQEVGKRVQFLRKSVRLTQEELAERTNLSVNYIAFIESGRRSPSLTTLQKIAISLQVDISDILNLSQTQFKKYKPKIKAFELTNHEKTILRKSLLILKRKIS